MVVDVARATKIAETKAIETNEIYIRLKIKRNALAAGELNRKNVFVKNTHTH